MKGDQVSRQVQTEMRKKKMLPASHVLKRGQRQKHGESKRTRVERGGPNQHNFTPSGPWLAGGKPKSRTRGTMQSSRCDLAWRGEWAVLDTVIGDAQGHACQNTRGNARAVRAVSQSPPESAAEDAGPSRRSEPRRDMRAFCQYTRRRFEPTHGRPPLSPSLSLVLSSFSLPSISFSALLSSSQFL